MRNQLSLLIALATFTFPTIATACAWSDGKYIGRIGGAPFTFQFDPACTLVSVIRVGEDQADTFSLEQRGKRLVAEIHQLVITFSGDGKRMTVQGAGGTMLSAKMHLIK